jgi:hypothetical protein
MGRAGGGSGRSTGSEACLTLEGLNELDETSGVAHFLAEAGRWAQKTLECEAACVMLVSLDGRWLLLFEIYILGSFLIVGGCYAACVFAYCY